MKANLEIRTGKDPYDIKVLVNGKHITKVIPIERIVLKYVPDLMPILTLDVPINAMTIDAEAIDKIKLNARSVDVSADELRQFIYDLQDVLEEMNNDPEGMTDD